MEEVGQLFEWQFNRINNLHFYLLWKKIWPYFLAMQCPTNLVWVIFQYWNAFPKQLPKSMANRAARADLYTCIFCIMLTSWKLLLKKKKGLKGLRYSIQNQIKWSFTFLFCSSSTQTMTYFFINSEHIFVLFM